MRTQTFVGNYVSPVQGEGIEPGDIRPFAPGDHVRHVNWRATLRLGTLHVTQHHRERNADVVLLLDTLSDVGPSGATVVDVAARAAATLAAAYLARKDRVGLIEYGGQLRWVKPGSGRAQFQRLLDTKHLKGLPQVNTDFHDLLYALSNSPRLIRMIDALRDHIYRYRQIILKEAGQAQASNEDHRLILRSIRTRDAEGVEQLVREHILRGQKMVLNAFESDGFR
jgi:uncharacterized protein (DUF58 family)